MGVDQNKGSWGSYNRRSTANQPRSQRWQSRKGFVLFNAILHRKICILHHSSVNTNINIYGSHTPVQRSIQTEWHAGATCRKWARDMAWASGYIGGFLNRLTIADFSIKWKSSRQNKYIADAVSDLGVWCSDFSMLCLLLAIWNRCKNASLFEWYHYVPPWHSVVFFNSDLPFLGGCLVWLSIKGVGKNLAKPSTQKCSI